MYRSIKNGFWIFVMATFFSCEVSQEQVRTAAQYEGSLPEYMQTITPQEMKESLHTLASDAYQGREAGTSGQKLAAQYLADSYLAQGIKSPVKNQDYFQEIPEKTYSSMPLSTENVWAYIPGKEKADEVLVISAHYDHVGMKDQEIFNGADDNGSGTVALLEIAEAFKQAVDEGYRPKRSILFLHFTAEEKGLYGSKYYIEHPIFPLDKTIADLNIDMIGRVDQAHVAQKNYVYLIGSDRLSADLHKTSEQVNDQYTQIALDYRYNAEDDPEQLYYRSDHYNFAKHNIPVIFYFNGLHQDYHQATDTPDKIDYEVLAKRAQLVFATAWTLANAPYRPQLNVGIEDEVLLDE